jgi:hypothetical protein
MAGRQESQDVDMIIAYENGELGVEETISLFQKLINSGLAWQLQGSYGRMANALIEQGYCQPAKIGA